MSPLLIASLVVNLVLLCLLLFKSALNDILTEYISERRTERRRMTALLTELRANLERLPQAYFRLLRWRAVTMRGNLTMEEQTQAKTFRDDSASEVHTIKEFIRDNRQKFSPKIQYGLLKVEQAMQFSFAELMSPSLRETTIDATMHSVRGILRGLEQAVQEDVARIAKCWLR